MKIFLTVSLLLAASASAPAGPGLKRSDEVQRLDRATEVFSEIMKTPDKGVPEDLLHRSACIAIVPGLKKGGLGLGGRYGKGVVMCRKGNGSWSAPSFMTVEGGSVGLQIGFQQIDLVMLIMNREGMEKLIGDKLTVGADASAAAGPVGRQTSAETNIRMDAKILTYSRAKGLFAGITLNGAVVKQDKDDNRDFYGREMEAREILFGDSVPMPREARALASALSWKSPRKR
ncbi:MAG TPA: lipid-binding SYLF domain-containing protein [Blastocatellia bacterium]|nr:lipid-binding SYLF domain-containing protein [Blastocatellia bacterium]